MLAAVVILAVVGSVSPANAAKDDLPAHDKQVINTLLDRLKERRDLRFIREDKSYGPATAAAYLRYKWDHNRDKVHNIQDFITLASYGGDHGEVTYYVQFSDGKREPAKDVLEQSLKQLEDEQTASDK